jgi:phage shock protein PspC (stress-responsive transcriptional regulator)
MKKTFTANISGTVFHIEEDAYDQLHRYLANIRAKFSGSTGSDEILSDIEARIAELFTDRLQGRQVVTMTDVEHVQQVMGQPEDFGGEEAQAGSFSGTAPTGGASKRLFRDTEDKWVAGVISGISAYFNVDPLWFRIAFIIFVVLGWGSPVMIYILLWILVPKAESHADRLRMRGEPLTVDNLKRAFDEGSDRFKAGAQRFSEEAKTMAGRWNDPEARQYSERVRSNIFGRTRDTMSVVGKVLGVILLMLGALFLFGLVMGSAALDGMVIGGRWWGDRSMGWDQLSDAWFITPAWGTWAWIGVMAVLLVPIIGLLLAGIRLLFDVRIPKWIGWTLAPLWVVSIFLLSMIGIRQAGEYRQRERVTEDIAFPVPRGQVLHIAAAHDPLFGDDRQHYSSDWDLIDINNGTITWGDAELDVKESPDSLYHLEVLHRANGASVKEALHRAKNIRSAHMLKDSLLTLSPTFTTELDDKLRGQEVSFIVRVPQGASVRFERGTARIIHDIDNTTNTWDGDMVGRIWTMTPQGLAAGTAPDTTRRATPTTIKASFQDGDEKKEIDIRIDTDNEDTPSRKSSAREGNVIDSGLVRLFSTMITA